jgi:hypothetical protein
MLKIVIALVNALKTINNHLLPSLQQSLLAQHITNYLGIFMVVLFVIVKLGDFTSVLFYLLNLHFINDLLDLS